MIKQKHSVKSTISNVLIITSMVGLLVATVIYLSPYI